MTDVAKINLNRIEEAQKRISKMVKSTPLREWHYLKSHLGFKAPIFLKLENLQRTGSFKVRGAANKLLSLVESAKTPSHVVAASAGNHAQGVAFVAGKLKIDSTIVMSEGAPLVKISATSDYGANVVLHGSVYDDAYAKAQEILGEIPGAIYIHAFDDADVICGQGTAGIEIHEQLSEAGIVGDEIQVVVPIGGGGLISGVATAIKALRPKSKIFGVVSEAAPAMAESFKSGKIVSSAGKSRTLAEGLAVKKVAPLPFEIIQKFVEEIAIVNDDEIALAIATLMERGKLVAEGAGAAGVAAAMAHKLKLNPNIPTVFVLCGGNIDMNLMSNILERGLSRAGRWLNLKVQVEDKPGELAKVSSLIASVRGNILEVIHDRISPTNPVGSTSIQFQLEARGPKHSEEIKQALEKNGYRVIS